MILVLLHRLYCALFWIQGKTQTKSAETQSWDCTVPYFGFKAKRATIDYVFLKYCTVPYFGFKAKHGQE